MVEFQGDTRKEPITLEMLSVSNHNCKRCDFFGFGGDKRGDPWLDDVMSAATIDEGSDRLTMNMAGYVECLV